MSQPHATIHSLDLDRHAVIEASAGTGKTYTIEKLVVRLLAEKKVQLEEILIMTFTEKATGDLKSRLRASLTTASQEDNEHANVIACALAQFDQAPIFTIHGFCQRLLQEYALEQGEDFRAVHVDDGDLLADLLRDIQRKHWRTQFGDRLQAVLENAGYTREKADKWDRAVIEIAQRFKPRSGHRLRPTFVPDWWRRLDEPGAHWVGQLQQYTVRLLHEQLREFKKQRGLQSFDDMIATVEENLDPERNPDADDFARRLRERFRYAIVDEFQDTDPLQWRIFRRIFLDGGDSKLFVVGDPKQAIFGFRGADLPTYLEAVAQMKDTHGAGDLPLDVNWRSEPDLLEGLNCLFQDGAWFPAEDGITYRQVFPPDPVERASSITSDHSDRAPLTVVDLSQYEQAKMAGKMFARFVGQEVRHLLGEKDRPLITFTSRGKAERALDAGDICILVMRRGETQPIMSALEREGVPYTFLTRTDLWKSDEADQLDALLRTLARPDDRTAFRKALLTHFFRVRPEDLARAPDLPAEHPARRLFQNWLGYAQRREWSALFGSIIEETGLLYLATQTVEGEQRLTQFRQLTRSLENAGHDGGLDLVGLLDWMQQRRQNRDNADGEIQASEPGRRRVKIMTMHASKGLEFPIVFLAGGFTQSLGPTGLTAYRDNARRLVFDLDPDEDAKARVNADRLSEYRRLFYVALTRPILKLYVPKIKKPKRTNAFLGPVGTILMPALEEACPDKFGPTVAEVIQPGLGIGHANTSAPATPEPAPAPSPFHMTGPLFPPVDENLLKRRIVIRSFSGMARHHLALIGEGASFGDQLPRAVDETPTPIDQEDPLRGPVFGSMLHNVLEEIEFTDVAHAASPEALLARGTPIARRIEQEIRSSAGDLRARMTREAIEQACRQQLAALVWHTLRTPLAEVGAPLCAIPREDRIPEVEFLFPEHPGETAPADARWQDGFVTGFMDLLFRRDGRYFLLDWKTNLLPFYTPDSLLRCMADSDYHRQYQLYLQAIMRWLKHRHGKGFDFLKQFGGVYYLFVRGMNGRDESTGVFFHHPTKDDLDLQAILK